MSSTTARRWIAVVAAATLGIGDLIVLDGIAAPAWLRSTEASERTTLQPTATPTQAHSPTASAPLAKPPSDAPSPAAETAAASTESAAVTPTAAPPARSTAIGGSVAPPAIEPARFTVGSSELGDRARASLLAVAAQMKSDLHLSVTLRGHADAAGEDSFNEQLSLQRARAAQEFLVASGIARDRVAVLGLAAREPIDPADTPEARALNRRVEIVWRP